MTASRPSKSAKAPRRRTLCRCSRHFSGIFPTPTSPRYTHALPHSRTSSLLRAQHLLHLAEEVGLQLLAVLLAQAAALAGAVLQQVRRHLLQEARGLARD